MDAYTIFVGLLVLFSGVSTQSPQDEQVTTVSSVSTQSPQDGQETTTETNTFGMNCTTPKDLPGNCMTRKDCDWSTSAIDLSLYKPSWYIKPCSKDELCCPYNYQVQPTEPPNVDDLQLQDDK